jgi:hypothetical protein
MAITIFGLVVCGLGMYISVAHWIVFYTKRQLISECEKILGIRVTLRRAPFPVQGVILLMYFLFAGALSGWLSWLLGGNLFISHIVACIVFVAGLSFSIMWALRMKRSLAGDEQKVLTLSTKDMLNSEKHCESDSPRFPLLAERHDLSKCLTLMGERPLKLVANKLFKNESLWDEPKWSFTSTKGRVEDKKLLLNLGDEFQLSLANEHSKQELHLHKKVFETYISESELEIEYVCDGALKTSQIASGALIIPPNVLHQVRLHGLTFVFQCALKGGTVHGDKQVARKAAI